MDLPLPSSLAAIVERPANANKSCAYKAGEAFVHCVVRAATKAPRPVTIITDPLFYLLALPAVVALGLSKGGFAGMGQMATPMLALVMPPLEAAAIMLPIMIVQDATALWVYRKAWSGRIIAIVIPGAIVGVGAGWLLAAHISDAR